MTRRLPAAAIPALAALIALAAGAAPAAAQQDDQEWMRQCERQGQRSGRAVFCEVRPVTVGLPAGRLEADAGRNGGIVVRGDGGARGEARVSARVQTQASSGARARELARDVMVHAAAGALRTSGPATSDGESWSVSFQVTVPTRTDLELVARNGPIAVTDVTGRIRAETRNGPLALERLAGDVWGRTQNGPLRVGLAGARWEGAGLDAETRNGPVSLQVPAGYSAELETGSINGPFDTRFPLEVRLTDFRSGRLRATLGEGGAPVRVVTTNGPATLDRESRRGR